MKRLILPLLLALSGCSSINPSGDILPPEINSYIPIDNYSFVLINESETVNSAVANESGGYTRTVDPDEAIAGVLLKMGVIRIYETPDTNLDKVALVSYGVSGTRNIGLMGAYSQEVTIVIREVNSTNLIYQCSAEGIGSTEADDIRNAISSCLSGL
ncbi:MAG: hypothetical protein JKX78_15130 [Alteromonadaceae bacterium]|nr:hypothetical protein [Alteromonadaceae bacterium]